MNANQSSDIISMQLAKMLKKQIQENEIKVTALSKATKVPLQTIHNWLAGQSPRDIEQVKAIADHFGVSLNFLCFGEVEKSNRNLADFKDEILAGTFEVVIRRPSK